MNPLEEPSQGDPPEPYIDPVVASREAESINARRHDLDNLVVALDDYDNYDPDHHHDDFDPDQIVDNVINAARKLATHAAHDIDPVVAEREALAAIADGAAALAKEKALADDLADVLAHLPIWQVGINGINRELGLDVERVLARYREARRR
jgi:hypothetical protein